MGVPLDEVAEARPQAAERFDRQTEPRSLRELTPHARDPSIDEEHRREPTLRPVHPLVMGRLDEMPVVLLAEEERVEKRKQTHDGPLQTGPFQDRQVFSQDPCDSTVGVQGCKIFGVPIPDRASAGRGDLGAPREIRWRRGTVGPQLNATADAVRAAYTDTTPH